MLGLLQADINRQDCTLLTQHLMGIALYAYTPQHKAIYQMPEVFRAMLKGKHELISNPTDSLNFA